MKFEEISDFDLDTRIRPSVFVYFLRQGDEVVYVGQTKNGLSRPLSHGDKEFDSISLILCSESELNAVESKYILKYCPKYNKTIPDVVSMAVLKKMVKNAGLVNVKMPKIKRFMASNNTETIAFNAVVYVTLDTAKSIIEALSHGGAK